MRILRWVLLALYLLIILGLFGMYLVVSAGESIFWLFLAMSVLFVVSQVVMLASAGTSGLCKPARRSHSAVPVILAALMMGILVVGLLLAIIEYASHEWEYSASLFWAILGASWLLWAGIIRVYTYRTDRYRLLKRLTITLLGGSVAQLLATVPMHIVTSRRPGCLAGVNTGLGVAAGICVMLWAFGPGIILLFLREKRRAELKQGKGPDETRE